jgi:hypothetical protein
VERLGERIAEPVRDLRTRLDGIADVRAHVGQSRPPVQVTALSHDSSVLAS